MKKILSLVAILSLVFSPITPAFAADANWTGASAGPANTDWSDATNWDAAPVPGTGNIATFNAAAGGGGAVINLGGGVTVGGIDVKTGADAYTIGSAGQTLTLDNGGAVAVYNGVLQTQTIAANVVLNPVGSNATFTNNGADDGFLLNVSGNVTGSEAGAGTLHLAGSDVGMNTVSGVISNGSGGGTLGVTKDAGSVGMWVLSGNNSYTGTTTVVDGTLRATNNATALGAGALTMSGGTLNLADNSNLNFGRNTTVTTASSIVSTRASGAGAGTTQTLGTLSIGASTLSAGIGDANTTSGTQGLTFGAVTLTGGATINAAGGYGGTAAGQLTLGDVTSAGNSLVLGSNSTVAITMGTMANLSGGLTITDAGGLVTLGALGSGTAGAVTIADSGAGVTFGGGVTATTLAITDSAAGTTVAFQGNTNATTGMSAGAGTGAYNVSMTGGTNTIAGATTFANTGSVAFGDGGDTLNFTGGVTHTAGANTINGNITGNGITLDNNALGTTIQGNSILDGNGSGITLGDTVINNGDTLTLGAGDADAITVDNVAGVAGGAASNLTFNTTGTAAVTGTVGTDIGTLTVTNSGGTTFGGAVGGVGDRVGTVALTDTTGTITFGGNLYATSLTAANGAGGYGVALNGGTTDITNAVAFNNTGNVAFGNGGDSLNFAAGVTHTAGTNTINGNITGNGITLDNNALGTTIQGNSILDGNGSGITLGDTVINNGDTLTLGAGDADAITVDNVAGVAGGAASNLTFNTTGTAAVTGTVGTDIGTLTVTNSGGTTFGSTVDAGTIAITDSAAGTTVAFQGNTNATTGMSAGAGTGAYNVSMTGGTNTIAGATTFANTGSVAFGDGGDTLNFTGGVTHTAGANTINGNITGNGITLDNNALGTTIQGNSILDGNGSGITLGDTVINNGDTLTLGAGDADAITVDNVAGVAGGAASNLTFNTTGTAAVTGTVGTDIGTLTVTNSGGTTFGGAVGGVGDRVGTVALTDTTGTITFGGNLYATSLTAANGAGGYGVALNGGTTDITNAVAFNNTGNVAFGNGGDSLNFAAGVTHTAGTNTINGNITGNGITLDNNALGTTIQGNSILDGNGSGITLGDTVINNGDTLTLGAGDADAITVDNVAGVAGGAASNLTFNTTGTAAVTGTVGTDIGTLTVTNSGGTTFGGAVGGVGDRVGTVALTDTTGTITFGGNLYATSLTAANGAGGYGVALNGGTTDITNAVAFNNTGNVAFGNGGDALNFAAGVTHTAGTNTINGNITSTNAAINLNNTTTVGGDSTLAAGSGLITLGATTIADSTTLTLGIGGTGGVTVASIAGTAGGVLNSSNVTFNTSGAVSSGAVGTDIGTLLITNSGGATFSSTVDAATITIAGSTAASTVAFQGNTNATSGMSAAAGAYNVSMTGGTNTIAGATTFANTGSLTLGNGGDTLNFTGGVTHTAGANTINGNINATNAAINLGNTTTVGGDSTLAAGSGLITLGATTIADSTTLTLGTGGSGGVTVASIAGTAGGVPTSSNVTFNTTGAVSSGAIGTDIGAVTISQSGGAAFSSTVNANTVAIADSALNATVSFAGNLTVATGMTVAAGTAAYNVSITGTNNSVAGTTTFNNAGTLTLGDAAGDTTIFVDGVNAIAPSAINIAGAVAATTGASAITLGDANTGVTVTANATVGGAATGAITMGAATLADGARLTVGTATGNAINLSSVLGNAGAGVETLIINTTGIANVSGAVGATGNALNQLTVTQSGGTTFASTVDAKNILITDTTDATTVSFAGNLNVTTGMTVANAGGLNAYNVSITGPLNAIAGDTFFLNSGITTLGDQASDSSTFAGGLQATAGAVRIAGTVATTNTQMDLGAVTMTADSTLSSGTAAINVASMGGDFNLTLQSDVAGATGAVTFTGNVVANDLITFARGYAVTLQGLANVIDSDTSFLNTGITTIGDGAADSSTFTGGLDATAGAVHIAGTVATTNTDMDLGAVTMTAASTLSSGTGNINVASVANGANLLTVNNTGASIATITGVIGSGNGGLTKNGTGTLTLNGINTYTGATTVNLGTLNLNQNLTTSLLSFGGAGTVNLLGGKNISGAVTTSSDGNGTLNFLGDSTTGGNIGVAATGDLAAVNIQDGTLTMNHDIAASVVTVDSVAGGGSGTLTLTGNRTITGNLTLANSGEVNVGMNTLNLAGTRVFTMPAGTTLNVAINGPTFGSIDARVGGVGAAAVINAGSTVNVEVGPQHIASGSTYTIVNTGGSGIGAAPGTITDNSYMIDFTGSGATGDLVLTAFRGVTYASVSTDANTQAVGRVLDEISAQGATGDMLNVLVSLDSMNSASQIASSIATMHPDVSSAAMQGTRTLNSHFLTAISNRLAFSRSQFARTGISTGDMFQGAGFWMQGIGGHESQGQRGGIQGYSGNTFGTTIGVDKLLGDHIRTGLAAGYGFGAIDAKTPGNPGTTINSWQTTLYGSYDSVNLCNARQSQRYSREAVRNQAERLWYVDGMLTFSQNNYNSSREISISPETRTAKADHGAQQYSTKLETGYTLLFEKTKDLEITPFASLGYNYLYMNRYTESGADSLNLHVAGQGFNQLEQGLGLKFAYPIAMKGTGTFIPSIKGAWLFDYLVDKFATSASFAGGGSSFNTYGVTPARNAFLVGSEVAFLNRGNMTLTGNFDLEFREAYTGFTYYLTLRFDF